MLSFLHPARFSVASQVCASITIREKRPKWYHLQFFERKIQRCITSHTLLYSVLSNSPVPHALSISHWNSPMNAKYDLLINFLQSSCYLAFKTGIGAGKIILFHISPKQRFWVHVTSVLVSLKGPCFAVVTKNIPHIWIARSQIFFKETICQRILREWILTTCPPNFV